MPIQTPCSACSAKVNIKDELIGKAIKCPKCGARITVSDPWATVPSDRVKATPPVDPWATAAPHDALRTPDHVARGDGETASQNMGGKSTVPQHTPASPAETVSVPGYDIEGVLGRGGMGVVYKARHRQLKRTVALKMILSGGHADPRELARFRIEAEAVARLQHPNIVQIHEVGETDGHPFCALEFVEGGNLAGKIDGKPMPPRKAARLVEPLARAMQLAHSRNVVHRDLKPANVLLDADDTPKITDFGLARQTDSDSGETQAGAVMGTPSYMAPEQASGRTHEAGPAADVYALGAILYDCLAGQPPFKGKTVVDTLDQVRTKEPKPPSRWHAGIPLDLETICLKCLRKEPEQRYASAAELADELTRFLRGEPILARPVGRWERCVKWVKRNPLVAGVSAALVFVLLSAVIVSSLLAVEANNQANAAQENANKAKEAADEQAKFAKKFKELAEEQTRLREESDERREKAENLAFQVRFNRFYSQANDNKLLAVVGMAQLLPDAARLKDPHVLESLRLHLAGWAPEAAMNPLRWVGAHGKRVLSLALSADGKIAVTGSIDKTARLWDAASGMPIGPPLQHQNESVAVALSADGKTALTGCGGNTGPQLWDVASGKPIGPPLQHQHAIYVALSADGKTALTGSANNTAWVWDAATGKPISPLQHGRTVQAVALSADGKTALTGSDKDARLWEVASGTPIGPPLHQGIVSKLALSPDGKTALTGSQDGTTWLWHVATGKPIGLPLQHQSRVTAVAFIADGKTALTGSADLTARLWDAASGKPISPPLRHQNAISSVALSADSKIALTGSYDKTARLWETATGNPIAAPLQHRAHAPGQGTDVAALSANGKTALTVHENTTRLWDVATRKPIGAPLQHQGVQALALSADGKTALTGSVDNTARLWNADTSNPIGAPLQHQSAIIRVALSADGKAALTVSNDTARLWDVASGKPIGPPLRHQNVIRAACLSADGKIALTGSLDKTARLWETATGNPIGPALEHNEPVDDVALSADGKTAVTGSRDKTARILNMPRLPNDPERIILWAQVITGIEADDHGNARALSADEWYHRKARLEKLGGPPLLD
jgi:WD40 repeat protein/serine/threonine protein kinase